MINAIALFTLFQNAFLLEIGPEARMDLLWNSGLNECQERGSRKKVLDGIHQWFWTRGKFALLPLPEHVAMSGDMLFLCTNVCVCVRAWWGVGGALLLTSLR